MGWKAGLRLRFLRTLPLAAAILTVTLNPSIDISAVTEKVTTEHKLRCTELRRLGRVDGEADLERELEQALKETFPASDAIAVDTLEEHARRKRRE